MTGSTPPPPPSRTVSGSRPSSPQAIPGQKAGPSIAGYETLHDFWKKNAYLQAALNKQCPRTAARLEEILKRLLALPRFQKYSEGFTLFLMDAPSNAWIMPYKEGKQVFPHNAVFLSADILHKLQEKTGALTEDAVAFVLAHELMHFLFRREKEKGEEYKLSHEEEMQADLQALRLMDEAGFSVHFAGFGDWLDALGEKQGLSYSHPDTWWREVKLQEEIRSRHFRNYREEPTAVFEETEIKELALYENRVVRTRLAELFMRTTYEDYVDQVETIGNGNEFVGHAANLFILFVIDLLRRGLVKVSELGTYHAGDWRTEIIREYEEKLRGKKPLEKTDLEAWPHFQGLPGFELPQELLAGLVSEDKPFLYYDLPSDETAARMEKERIVRRHFEARLFGSVTRHLISHLTLFDQGKSLLFKEKDLAEATGVLAGKIRRLAQKGDGKIKTIYDRGIRPAWTPLRRDLTEMGGLPHHISLSDFARLLEAWPTETFFRTAEQRWLPESMTCGVYLESLGLVGREMAEPIRYQRHHLVYHLERLRTVGETLEAYETLVAHGGSDRPDYFLNPSRPGCMEEEPWQRRLRDFSLSERIKALQGAIEERNFMHVGLLMDVLPEEEKERMVHENFDFFSKYLSPLYGPLLLKDIVTASNGPVPNWAKTTVSRKMIRLFEFLKTPEAAAFQAGRQENEVETLLCGLMQEMTLLGNREELSSLAQYLLDLFPGVHKNFMTVFEGEINFALVLFVMLKIIREQKWGEWEALSLPVPPHPSLRKKNLYDRWPYLFHYRPYTGGYFLEYLTLSGGACLKLERDTLGLAEKHDRKIFHRMYEEFLAHGFDALDLASLQSVIMALHRQIAEHGSNFDNDSLLKAVQILCLKKMTGDPEVEKLLLPAFFNSTRLGTDHDRSYGLLLPDRRWIGVRPIGSHISQRDDDKNLLYPGLKGLAARLGPALLWYLPPHLGMEVSPWILPEHRFPVEWLRRANDELRDEIPFRYRGQEGDAWLPLMERAASISSGDYIAFHYLHTIPDVFHSVASLSNAFESFWPVPSSLRDVVLARFVKNHPLSRQDLVRVAALLDRQERIWPELSKAYEEWRVENPGATFWQEIGVLASIFPQKNPDRDALVLDLVNRHDLEALRYKVVSNLLCDPDEGHKSSLIAEHFFENRLQDYAPEEKKDVLTWLLGIRASPPEHLREDLKKQYVTPEEFKKIFDYPAERAFMLKSLLVGNNGLCLPLNRAVRARLFDDIWHDLFGPRKGQTKQQQFVLDVLKLVFGEVDVYKQYLVLETLCHSIHGARNKKEIVTLEKLVARLLPAYGPEGVKLGQILSSYQGLWEKEPQLAQALSDLQDQSSLMNPYLLFDHLVKERGIDAMKDIVIHPAERAGSIKGFFTAERKSDGSRFGLLYLRPQVTKNLGQNRDELVRILLKIRGLVAEYYGGSVPDKIPDLVYQLIRREVDFRHEKEVLEYYSTEGKNEAGFGYPTLLGDWTTRTTIGISLIPSPVSLKTMVGLDRNPTRWNTLAESERGLVRKLMKWPIETPFDPAAFHKKLGEICSGILMKLLIQLREGRYVHGDLHPGNILIQITEGGDTRDCLIDLGASVELEPRERQFLLGTIASLFLNPSADGIKETVKAYFGRTPDEDWAALLRIDPRFRTMTFLKDLDRLGLGVPDLIRELLFSTSKADALFHQDPPSALASI